MRSTLGFAAAAAVVLGTTVAAGALAMPATTAAADEPDVGDCAGDSYESDEDYCVSVGEGTAPENPVATPSGPAGIVRLVRVTEGRFEGSLVNDCIRLVYGWFRDADAYAEALAAGDALSTVPAIYEAWPVCLDDEGDEELEADPHDLATVLWADEIVPLDDFEPLVEPAEMVAGLATYLQTRADPDLRFAASETLLGWTFVFDATGATWVDWGEGVGWEGPHQTAGEPWPDGRLTHAYRDPGAYRIGVELRWTGTWTATNRADSAAGALPERTQARELTLPVHEVRGLRSR